MTAQATKNQRESALEQEAMATLFTIEELTHARARLGDEDALAVARGTLAGSLSFLQAHAGLPAVRTVLLRAIQPCDARLALESDITGAGR